MNKYTGTSTLESMSQAGFYNQWTLRKFSKFLKGNILEIGCGIGNFTKTLSKYGSITAIDIDEYLIKTAKKQNNANIKIGFGNIEKRQYFFKEKLFDTIVCINVLEHIKDDEKALENMYKLLKKEGDLILLVPIYNFLYGEIDRSIGHFRRYDSNNLVKKMQGSGYRIVSSKRLNFVGAIGWFLAGKVFKNKNVEAGKIQLFNILAPFFLFMENFFEPLVGTSILIIAKKDSKT